MTSEEAINLLWNAYHNEVAKGGRGCGKTAFRTALLMGICAIKAMDSFTWENLNGLSPKQESEDEEKL